MLLNLPAIEATKFLLSLRSAFLQRSPFQPKYVTFFVSDEVFNVYMKETEATTKLCPSDGPDAFRMPTRYFLRTIRVRPDNSIVGLGSRVSESRNDYEEFYKDHYRTT